MLNPLSFRPWQVTLWTIVTYLALLIPLIIINESVPTATTSESPYPGVNLTEAGHDLAILTKGYHPYNSHQNDEVRNWLLLRIEQILNGNRVNWSTESSIGGGVLPNTTYHRQGGHIRQVTTQLPSTSTASAVDVVVFNDLEANLTFSFTGITPTKGRTAAYFEGTNVYVYIRGKEDPPGKWWADSTDNQGILATNRGGVLVNAHYDSVSTGYGATDDGIGVITILQLISHFTTKGQQPTHGIIALLNNAEEDYLYGARAFGNSPVLPFVHTFLNLEGAGAGGRAILFRSSDQQVTAAYARSHQPFGTVLGSDGFGLGLIKSQTDYVVFNGAYGARGLDLAFYKPRSRYHTAQDDVRHTSHDSLWHMLDASLSTVQDLTSRDFSREGDESRSDGVWFDLFGRYVVLFDLRGMFAWSVTLLAVSPLVLILVSYLVAKQDKYYLFSKKKTGGLKGLSRFVLVDIAASAAVFAVAFVVRKVNPFIIHSSQYVVWSMLISLFYFVFWILIKVADAARPSALYRAYAHIWLFSLSWLLLVAVTIFEDQFQIASGYPFVFWHSAVFLSTLISLLELLTLPKKNTPPADSAFIRDHANDGPSSETLIAPGPDETSSEHQPEDTEDPASENTPLLGGNNTSGDAGQRTFTTTYRKSLAVMRRATSTMQFSNRSKSSGETVSKAYHGEQEWSSYLPTWTWLIQFMLLGPFTIILVAQSGLLLIDAVHQTGADGSNPLIPYLMAAFFSIMLLIPLTPFINRISYHIPIFLLFVCIGSLIFNLFAFPFSTENQYKAFWQQTIDLDTGENRVMIGGVEEYIRPIIAALPSASGKSVTCNALAGRPGLKGCTYDGSTVPPNVAGNLVQGIPPEKMYKDLITISTARDRKAGVVTLSIDAKNTKACYIVFAQAIGKFHVRGSTPWDDRFGAAPKNADDGGITQLKLWRRDWNKTWTVDISTTHGLSGNVTCAWSDINTRGTIPALDEALAYTPTWAAITKYDVGLVDGTKRFQA